MSNQTADQPQIIVNTTGEQPQTPLRAAIAGLSGAGKTALAATCPAPLILNAERGLATLTRANIERMYGPNEDWVTYNVPFIDVKTVAALKALFAWLQTPAAAEYKTIILDSLSDIAEVVLAEALKTAKDPRQAYLVMAQDILNMVRAFRNLPTHHHIIFLCKAEKNKCEITGATTIGMSFPGKMLPAAMPYLLDEIWYIETAVNGNRQIKTKGDWQFQAKSRNGGLEALEYPSIYHMLAKMGYAV